MYIRTREGWLYLAAHKDLFHGEGSSVTPLIRVWHQLE